MFLPPTLWITLLLLFVRCSQAEVQSRIVGGSYITIEQRPYHASLQVIFLNNILHICGASIIHPKYLLTSAECNPSLYISYSYARVGSTNYGNGGQVLKVASFLVHPNFNKPTLDYDAAIVGFNPGVEIILGPTVKLIRIPDFSGQPDPPNGSQLVIAGWGTDSQTNIVMSPNLRQVSLFMYTRSDCVNIYSFLSPRQFCVGGWSDGKGFCFGDGGAPLTQNGVQLGIASGGRNCSAVNVPFLITKVSEIRDWLAPYISQCFVFDE